MTEISKALPKPHHQIAIQLNGMDGGGGRSQQAFRQHAAPGTDLEDAVIGTELSGLNDAIQH